MTAPLIVSPKGAQEMLRAGAQLIDIREPDERAAGTIEGGRSLPLSTIMPGSAKGTAGQAVIFHCRTGRRTTAHAETLQAAAASEDIYLLDGGLDAWAAAGLPVVKG